MSPPQNPRGTFAAVAAHAFRPQDFDADAVAKRLLEEYPEDQQLQRMLEKRPELALLDRPLWTDKPFADELTKVLLKKKPECMLGFAGFGDIDVFNLTQSLPNAKEWTIYAASKDPVKAIEKYEIHKDKPYIRDILLEASASNPAYILGVVKVLKDYEAKHGHGPYQTNLPYPHLAVMQSVALKQDLVKAASERAFYILYTADLYKSLPNAAKIKATALEEDSLLAHARNEPEVAFLSARLFKQTPYAGEVLKTAMDSVKDFKKFYKDIADELNNLHDEGFERRFSAIDNDEFDAAHLFDLITGDTVLYASTFNGAFNFFLKKFDSENIGVSEFFNHPDRNQKATKFFDLAITFNRFNDLYQRVPEDNRSEFMGSFIDKAKKGDLKSVALAASAVSQVHDKAILKEYEEKLIRAYEAATDGKLKDKLGLLASSYAETHKGEINYPLFFESIQDNPRYKLRDLERVETGSVYDKHGRNFQIMPFYKYYEGKAEPDGDASFNNFLQTYKKDPVNWKVEERPTYVHVSSRTGSKQVHIYANRPEYDGSMPGKNGFNDVQKAAEKMIPPVDQDIPVVMIHRGHSYHLKKTIENIEGNVPIMFVGSCGGTQDVDAVIKKAPDAHIIMTSATGTMRVNDPLLFHINDKYLRQGKPIVWDEVWKYLGTLPGADKAEYINPSDNVAAQFIGSYYLLHEDDRLKADLNPLAPSSGALVAQETTAPGAAPRVP